jgi:hypothetical protein
MSAVCSTYSSTFPPASLSLARPEQEGIHVAPSRVATLPVQVSITSYGRMGSSDISCAYSDHFRLLKSFREHIGRVDGRAPDPVALLFTVEWQIGV